MLGAGKFSLGSTLILSGTSSVPTATINVRKDDENLFQQVSYGENVMSVVFGAVSKATGVEIKVVRYSANFVQSEPVKASVTIDHAGEIIIGNGLDGDLIEALAMAYLDAINMIAAQA